MEKSLKVLQRKKEEIFKKIPYTDEIVKGTLIEMHNVCGKANCKCQRGEKHNCLGLSYYADRQSKVTYIPKTMEKDFKRYVGNYKRVMRCINEISKLNIEIMKGRHNEGRDKTKKRE